MPEETVQYRIRYSCTHRGTADITGPSPLARAREAARLETVALCPNCQRRHHLTDAG